VVVVEEEKAGSMDYYIYEALEKFPSVFGGHFKYINIVSSKREGALCLQEAPCMLCGMCL
jgi:hypothetical protein